VTADSGAQLLVLAKAPVPGRVKTRLCPPCTPEQAARVAAASLADTLAAARGTAGVTRAVLALDGAMPPPAGAAVVPQRGGGLGERIAAAFADATATGPRRVLQVGMDTPQAGPDLLASCLSTLDRSVDAVLGPAEDGGWWALGLHDPGHARLLAGVPMSTPDTGRLTLRALRCAGLRVAPLPTLRDVDTWADATAVAALAPAGRFAAAVAEVAA
jgi:rSAM/selenodomain-associated transferase 1